MRSTSSRPLAHLALLDEARRAQRLNFVLPAGVLARCSLESHLRLLCDWYVTPTKKNHPSIAFFASRLLRNRVIDAASKDRIVALGVIGNRAADNAGIEWWEVAELIDGVEEVIARFPLDAEQLDILGSYNDGTHPLMRDDDDDDGADWWKDDDDDDDGDVPAGKGGGR